MICKKLIKTALPFLLVCLVAGCAQKDLQVERLEAYQAYQKGDYRQAAVHFERLVEKAPKDAEFWFRLGNSYARSKQPRKAIEAYENALLRNPEMAKAWYNKGLIYLQAALQTFVEMNNYIADDDPVGLQGELLRKGVFDLLEEPGTIEQNEE